MSPRDALLHAMRALDEEVPEDKEALDVLRRLDAWLLANAEDMSLDDVDAMSPDHDIDAVVS